MRLLCLFGKETKDWSNLLSLEPKLPHYPFIRGNLSPGELNNSCRA